MAGSGREVFFGKWKEGFALRLPIEIRDRNMVSGNTPVLLNDGDIGAFVSAWLIWVVVGDSRKNGTALLGANQVCHADDGT